MASNKIRPAEIPEKNENIHFTPHKISVMSVINNY